MIDQDAPNEPTCHIPQDLVYTFDPAAHTLELRREEVIHDLIGGKCVRKSASFAPPELLTRVDVRSATDRATLPPAGIPGKSNNDDAELKKKLDAQNLKKPSPKKQPPKKTAVIEPQAPTALNNEIGNLPQPQAPQPPAPQNAVAPEPQKVTPKNQANPPAQSASGDSQIAPVVPAPVQQRKK